MIPRCPNSTVFYFSLSNLSIVYAWTWLYVLKVDLLYLSKGEDVGCWPVPEVYSPKCGQMDSPYFELGWLFPTRPIKSEFWFTEVISLMGGVGSIWKNMPQSGTRRFIRFRSPCKLSHELFYRQLKLGMRIVTGTHAGSSNQPPWSVVAIDYT
jgi:hypothetical protein